MSRREIVLWPDPRLATPCAPVAAVTADIETLAEDMLETMYAAPGRGLAAPQVGVLLRLFVMDTEWKDAAPAPRVFLNPAIVAVGPAQATRAEGCLSIPGITAEVTRPATVRLRWTDLDGVTREEDFDGFAAACVQHEIDHLDGVVTLDRIDGETRARLVAEYGGGVA
jgi:peptide deformylase